MFYGSPPAEEVGNSAHSADGGFYPPPLGETAENVLAADAMEDAKMQQFINGNGVRRRHSVSAAPVDVDRLMGWMGPPVYEKTEAQRQFIMETIARSPQLEVLFGHLAPQAIDQIASAMFLREVAFGQTVIRQGEDGDYFYIVHNGVFEIFVQRSADRPPDKVLEATPGSSFGELALMYNVPRAATVTCSSPGHLWCLERETFQMMLVTAANAEQREYEGLLSQIDVLRDMTKYELGVLSDLLKVELFDGGEEITRQGGTGDKVFILYDGEARAYINGDGGEVEVKVYSLQGEFFGEIALLLDEPRRATVRACGSGCSVLTLSREDLDLAVGPIRERLMQNIEQYASYSQSFGG